VVAHNKNIETLIQKTECVEDLSIVMKGNDLGGEAQAEIFRCTSSKFMFWGIIEIDLLRKNNCQKPGVAMNIPRTRKFLIFNSA
jgi:hypothetical protein